MRKPNAMPPHAPEFSRLLAIEGITPDRVRKESVEATEEECEALARRLDLRELSGLKAKLAIRRVAGGTAVRIEGDFEAEVVQSCVISLREVPSHVAGHFETFFTEDKRAEDDLEFSSDDAEDTGEMIVNGMIDLGEVVAQYLSLELDPYPRAPGVSLAAQMAETGAKSKPSPFLVLEGMKDEKKKPAAKKKLSKKPAKDGKKKN
jgi:uncharacterized metal-binding protein YceD (DUF177 family)